MVTLTKRKKKSKEQFNMDQKYSLKDAVDSIEKFPKTKFDETVELHFLLGINPKNSNEAVRGTVILPHGTGKNIKVAVCCKGELEKKAKEAGADFVGSQELIDKISKGFLDFDVIIAAPDMMRDLSKLGKILGPRGLMPSPKSGTVTADVENAIKEVKAGKVEFKADKQAGIHIGIGKRSFSKEKLFENAKHIVDAISNAKPATLKGNYIKSLSLTTTMGLGLRIDL